MQRQHLLLGCLATSMLITACGGSDDDPERGSLLEEPATITTLTVAQIDALTAAHGQQALTGKAKCDVQFIAINFNTIGVKSEPANSSGVLMLPAGPCAQTAAPLLAYSRGTEVNRDRTLANPNDTETAALAAIFAAQGYAVVAPDYLGYAKSTYTYHPYIHADSEATTMVDAIRAARAVVAKSGAPLNGKVFVTGYSQGGHASMSTHRAIERDYGNEFQLAAAAHLAGPYNVSGGFADVAHPSSGSQFFGPMMITSWQKVYGNIYTDVNQVFKAPYASYIESLLPSSGSTFTNLVTSGKLPGGPGVTAVQANALIYQASAIADIASNPNNPVIVDAKKNNLFGWNPKASTLLCQGSADPIVPYALNQTVIKADFDSRGLTNVSTVDVDPFIKAAYGVNGQAPTDPASEAFATYYGNYHGSYAVGFCYVQARAFFDAKR